jgi:predicted transcriptional regulator
MALPGIAIVTSPTRLEGLRRRWGTLGQAKFRLKQAHVHEMALRAEAAAPANTSPLKQRRTAKAVAQVALPEAQQQADFDEYQQENVTYQQVIDRLEHELQFGLPITKVERAFVPNFDFGTCEVVIVVGQDGLVANTAKYVRGLPIVAVNPDPQRIDGVLLPFQPREARTIVRRGLDGKHKQRPVTQAEAELNDGQKLLAFKDFFLGAASHVSARYVLEAGGRSEPQSSSGVLVSTGAGSTGWLSSVFNMTGGIARFLGDEVEDRPQLAWEDRKLVWAVREPFVSKRSQASLVAGWLPSTIWFDQIDEFRQVPDRTSFTMARRLAREEGILIGGSAGLNVWLALEVARELDDPDCLVVTILADTGERYLSKVFSDEWMQENQMLEAPRVTVEQLLERRSATAPALVSVAPAAAVRQALNLMTTYGVSQIPVVDNGESVGGLIEGTLMTRALSQPSLLDRPVREVMEQPFPEVDATAPADRVGAMLTRESPATLVRKDGKLIGIVSRYDVLQQLIGTR